MGDTNRMKINRLSLFVFAVFYLTPIFDALTGFLVLSQIISENFIGSPSQILRGVILLLSFRFLSRKGMSLFFAFLLFFLFIEIISFFFHARIDGFITALVFTYKLLFPIAIYFALKNIIANKMLSLESINRLFFNSGFLYSIGIIIPFILGIGFSTYASGAFGTKGLYASGNGIGMFLGIISVFSYQQSINRTSNIDLIKFSIILIALVLVGTKAALIFIVLLMLLYYSKRAFNTKLVLILSFIGILSYLGTQFFDAFSTVYDVVVYRYKTSDSFLTFILSGRNHTIENAFKEYSTEGSLFFRPFIGSGSFLSFRSPLKEIGIFDTLETDFFDIFFMYGIFGLSIYLTVLFKAIYMALKKKLTWLGIFICVVFAHSLIAGHVIFNGMSIMGVIMILINIHFQNSRAKQIYA